MIRSMLFIPGNNPAMLQNADIFGADAVILDLEDAVSPQEKDAARALVKAYLESVSHQAIKVYIRINGLDTEFYERDLHSVVSDQIDGIVLPKARVGDIEKLLTILYKIESETHMKKTMGIIPIVESAKSVLEIEKLAAHPVPAQRTNIKANKPIEHFIPFPPEKTSIFIFLGH